MFDNIESIHWLNHADDRDANWDQFFRISFIIRLSSLFNKQLKVFKSSPFFADCSNTRIIWNFQRERNANRTFLIQINQKFKPKLKKSDWPERMNKSALSLSAWSSAVLVLIIIVNKVVGDVEEMLPIRFAGQLWDVCVNFCSFALNQEVIIIA